MRYPILSDSAELLNKLWAAPGARDPETKKPTRAVSKAPGPRTVHEKLDKSHMPGLSFDISRGVAQFG
ncbi:unnamed protein product [marine sediment metagenome]|uniref:Uncharacterized protein n=1 Tax=marine sediment metagenome TaxID=412755 RepID=X1ITI1_9ZZZZ